MAQKEHAALYHALLSELLDRSYLRRAHMTKRALLSMLQGCNFRARLDAMLLNGGFMADDVLTLCLPVMDQLSPAPGNGWLQEIYRLLQDELYPAGDQPEEVPVETWRAMELYLRTLRHVLRYAKAKETFDPMTHFLFATKEECEGSPNAQNYEAFFDMLDKLYILELLHIGRVAMPFDLLGHIAGVHHIAMHMGRQLKALGVAVDLPLVSAAAATHDLGKYGCRGEEMQRIPYLHYYYTEELLKRYNLDAIAHVAANHSTWDLELENLPVESLLLIYADFRVKSVREKGKREQALFYTLKASYDVILGKLDNVDDKKRDRYTRVYAKLKDFEDYMVSRGVNPDPYDDTPLPTKRTDPALLSAQDAIEGLKFQAISHNLQLMRKISSDTSFADLLEEARGEKQWKNIRTYLNIIEEYFTYMTQKQKQLTMRFLYELFMHRQGDIRSQAAMLYGRLLASFDAVYRKEFPKHAYTLPAPETTALELWKQTLELLLLPDHKLAQKFRTWISYSLKMVLISLLTSCDERSAAGYIDAYLFSFADERYQGDAFTSFILLDSIVQAPRRLFTFPQLRDPILTATALAASEEAKHQAVALRFARWMFMQKDDIAAGAPAWDIIHALPGARQVGIDYLLLQVYRRLSVPAGTIEACEKRLLEANISDLFLDNLKTATPWVMKEANIRFLMYRINHDGTANAFQVATHFVNLIRVSERFAVRHRAGQGLVRIAELLTLDQRNEIAVELTRGLENMSDEFSKYIPLYLGQFILYLRPQEFDEVLDEFEHYVKTASERSATIALTTLGILLKYYEENYMEAFSESREVFVLRRRRILSILLGGLAHYNENIAREAFLVLGKQVFGGDLPHERKDQFFALVHKKLLLLIEEQAKSTLTFFNHAATLNHIYRYIIDSTVRFGPIKFKRMERVAFFPGTFDPFSSSHKEIVRIVKRLGFEVYLALDEFSWSKRTQPHMTRRRIMNMSVADLYDVYLFPDDIPVNLANPADLKYLKELFPEQEVYVAVGSDVVQNASAYKKEPEPCSIHNFGHIVFLRSIEENVSNAERKKRFSRIKGDVVELTLDSYFEEVSSTRIRENIDNNREISMLVDPVAQGYIYDNGLYLREPEFKELLRPETLYFKQFSPNDSAMRGQIFELALQHNKTSKRPLEPAQLTSTLNIILNKPNARLLALFNDKGTPPLGIACFYPTSAEDLYEEFQNIKLAEYVRRHTSGLIAVIGGLWLTVDGGDSRYDHMRLLLTEMLAECLKANFTYALHIGADSVYDELLTDILMQRGFLELPYPVANRPVYAVDMRVPIALIEDVQQRIKAPLSNDPEVLQVLRQCHRDFTGAMTKLYPGTLVLSFHAGLLNHSLIHKVLRANHVEHLPADALQLGECMCVPYGKTLRGMMVPNTVTKTLHADKAYMPDMLSFKITKYPGYSSLINQIRTIKSFNRPVFLVDDLLHKGYRLEALDPLFKKAGLDIKQIIVGILSGRGKDLMSVQDRQVESVYFIPNLRYWFVDSMLYPFLGGDSVAREELSTAYLLPSVNQIFPYTSPQFISGASKEALFGLSLTCLNNAKAILQILERRHQDLFGYNLTLNRLGQAMQTARVPDKGACMHYDRNLAPSVYVDNDIEMLLRLELLLK